jgi:hypothetical protein
LKSSSARKDGIFKIVLYPPIIVKNGMKAKSTAAFTLLLTLSIGSAGAADIEPSQFMEDIRLLGYRPSAPVALDGAVLFTASGSYHRVGVAFAHEGYGEIHWYKKLTAAAEPEVRAKAAAGKTQVSPTRETGLLFHLQPVPKDLTVMEYRMIIDGLWTPDPLNPRRSVDTSGLVYSAVPIPPRSRPPAVAEDAGALRFFYRAAPGETVAVAGSFNNWDPFMYELAETRPGEYRLTLPLPPGVYQYAFFHRGERLPDPLNPRVVYSPDGKSASEARVE